MPIITKKNFFNKNIKTVDITIPASNHIHQQKLYHRFFSLSLSFRSQIGFFMVKVYSKKISSYIKLNAALSLLFAMVC